MTEPATKAAEAFAGAGYPGLLLGSSAVAYYISVEVASEAHKENIVTIALSLFVFGMLWIGLVFLARLTRWKRLKFFRK